MFKINKLTDYAMLVITRLAEVPEALLSAHQLAEECHLELPTVSKVLKLLGKAELLSSVRGAHGGYRLQRAAQEITITDVICAIEGPIGVTECSAEPGSCSHEPVCQLRGNWHVIDREIHRLLDNLSIADMLQPLPAKHAGPKWQPIKLHFQPG